MNGMTNIDQTGDGTSEIAAMLQWNMPSHGSSVNQQSLQHSSQLSSSFSTIPSITRGNFNVLYMLNTH